MKFRKKILACVLSVLLTFLILPINKTYASQIDNSNSQIKSESEVGKQGDLKENSFRYKDGVPIHQDQNDQVNIPKTSDGRFNGDVGIDVSYHQGQIDWQKVKDSGVSYAMIRCGYGDDQANQDDTQWSYNVSECERLGIPYGVYLYSYADSDAHAQSELNHALRLLNGHNPQLPVYYDLEDKTIDPRKTPNMTSEQLLSDARIFENGLQNAGYKVGIYACFDWWSGKTAVLTSEEYNNWSRWIARWNDYCGYDRSYAIWQITDDGQVAGINNRVDMNILHNADIQTSVYKITSCVNNSSVVDIYNGSCDSGANAQLYSSNDTLAQRFKIQRCYGGDMNDFYKISNINSYKPLDIDGANPNDCTNLKQWEDNGSDAQYFKILDVGNGQYAFWAKCGGKCINIAGGYTSDGTNIWMYHYDNTNACKFTLERRLSKNYK